MSFYEKYPNYSRNHLINSAADHEAADWFADVWKILSAVQDLIYEDVLLRTTGCIDSGLL